jgi:ADP-dependent NAD(P)H-hydrate dehydratase
MSPVQPLDSALLRSMPLPRPGDGGKDERGRVLIAGGGPQLPGAVKLAGEAAVRAGAGKLQMAVAASAAPALGVAMPEARIIALPERGDALADHAHEALGDHLSRCDALLLGPGLMADGEPLARAVLEKAGALGLVLDAGALGGLSQGVFRAPLILTPHAGEMARLLDISREAVEADPLAAARRASERFSAVVAMKGASTYVVEPGRAALYAGGGPGLGVSGSGDVLAGVIVGLLARGVDPFAATAWGVWLHGEAGRRLAERIGPLGFLARELPREIPALLGAFA